MSTLKAEYRTPEGQLLQISHGDLTQEATDAIVNAANQYLSHGAGVAGAIVRRGGEVIQHESDRWVDQHGQVATGQVAVTGASALACRYVIHAVGPIWNGGGRNEEALLRSAVQQSLLAADELQLTSIALPAISSGIFGFPKDRCAAILVQTALQFFADHAHSTLRVIRLTNIDLPTTEALQQALTTATNQQQP